MKIHGLKETSKQIAVYVMYRIRGSMIFRRICKPAIEFQRRRLHREYLQSEHHRKLQTIKNCHAGERCFIIGNGPSLNARDLEKIKDEYCFAANRIYEIFEQTSWRPTYYIAIDANFLAENYETMYSYPMQRMFIPYNVVRKKKPDERVIGICRDTHMSVNIWNDQTAYISEDMSDHFSEGYTVTFASIQMAIYMGFREIYLLGIDFNYSIVRDERGRIHRNENIEDYFSGKRYNITAFNYHSSLNSYKVAKKYCDQHGIKICNATRGGKLEVFERIDFDGLVSGENKA